MITNSDLTGQQRRNSLLCPYARKIVFPRQERPLFPGRVSVHRGKVTFLVFRNLRARLIPKILLDRRASKSIFVPFAAVCVSSIGVIFHLHLIVGSLG